MSDTISDPSLRRAAGARISALDGYRGVAVLSIVIYHYLVLNLQVEPGTPVAYVQRYFMSLWIGVDAFFVLSGFLIGGILLDQRHSSNLFSVFYLRRALRIFPPYILLMICWLAAMAVSDHPAMGWLLEPIFPVWPYLLYVQNFWMAVLGGFGPNFVAATWSLAIEEQFYLFFPLAIRLAPSRALPLLLGAGVLFPPAVRFLLAFRGPDWKQALVVLLPLRWDSLVVGVLVAWIVRQELSLRWVKAHRGSTLAAFLTLTLWMMGLPLLLNIPDWMLSPWRSLVVHTGIALFFGLTLLLLFIGELQVLAKLLSSRILRYFGKVSYYVYLFHTPFLGVAFVVVLGRAPSLTSWIDFLVILVALSSCIASAELSWRWIEGPLVRFGHSFGYRFQRPLGQRALG